MKKRSTVLAFRLSNAQRTVLAYFALLFSILCMVTACATTTYSYLQHVLLDDISLLVRGYSASGVLLTISIVGTVLEILFIIGCYVCFCVSGLRDRKRCNSWLFAYIVILIIVVIVLCYLVFQCYVELQQPTVKRSLQTDLLGAMKNYSKVAADKSRIDRMHVNFRCCGSRGFTDWWHVEWCTTWVDPLQITAQRRRDKNGLYLKDDVPFSCCNPSVIRPCVHQAMRDQTMHAKYPVGNSTLYKNGCSLAVHRHTAFVGSWVLYGIALLAVLTIMLLVICRYLQTSITEALRAGDLSVPSRGYLLSFGQRKAPGTRAPPPSPATRPSSPEPAARRKKVGKTKSKSKPRPRRNVNKSNRQVNNSAALSELVDELLSDNVSHWSANTDLELIADQLAPSSLSDGTQTTSGQLSDSGTTPDLPYPTAMLPGTASPQIPVVHMSDSSSIPSVYSSSLPSSSPISRLQDNWNANANARSLRPTESDATADVALDHRIDDPDVSKYHTRSKSSARRQTWKYHEQSKTRLRSTSTYGRRCITTQRLGRLKDAEHSYRVAEKSAESRNSMKSNIEDSSVTRPNAGEFSSPEQATQSEEMKTHGVEYDRHSEKEYNEDLKSVSQSGPVSYLLDYSPKASASKIWQHSSPPAEPSGEGVCPLTESAGLLESYSTDGRSSEWSTVSCQTQTVGDGTFSESKQVTLSTKQDVSGINKADAFLLLNKYLKTYTDDVPTFTEKHESRRRRSQKSLQVVQNAESRKSIKSNIEDSSVTRPNVRTVQKSSASAADPGRMYQAKELMSVSKSGRLSSNSWSTVSCQTISRPPSSTFHNEIIVEEKRLSRSASEHVRQTNNSCNWVPKGRFNDPEMRRLLSNILQKTGIDRRSSCAHRSAFEQTNNSNSNTLYLRATQSAATAGIELDRITDDPNISRRQTRSKSSGRRQTPKYPEQSKTRLKSRSKDNSGNSVLKRHADEPDTRELLSTILQQADIGIDRSSSSASSPGGQASRDSRPTLVAQSELQSLQPNLNIKPSITSVLSSPMVHAAIRAIQLRPDEAASKTSSGQQSPFDSTVSAQHSGLASSGTCDRVSHRMRRQSADYRARMEQIQQIQCLVDSLKLPQQSLPFQCHQWSLGQSDSQLDGTFHDSPSRQRLAD